MYIKKEYICGNLTEVELYHKGNYGAPGKTRGKKKKPSTEEMKKANEINRKKTLRRLINTNFKAGDIHLILTYAKENRPNPEESKEYLDKFIRTLSRRYKKHGEQFKWVKVTEYKNKAIHHHMIINCPDSWDPSKDIASIWTRGRPKQTRLDGSGNYSQLAEYLIKETSKSFSEDDSPQKLAFSHSRNLKKPTVHKKTVRAGTWKKIPTPKKGYYILPDSIYEGINQITGHRYRYYTMLKIQEDDRTKRSGKKVRDG